MSSRTVVILHDKIAADAREDELDDLVQVEAVAGALHTLGYETASHPFDLKSMGDLVSTLESIRPAGVVNLVETIDGSSSLCFTACAVLDSMGIKYSGSSASAVFISTNKVITKRMLRSAGLPTPEWIESSGAGTFLAGERYLMKPVSEEGSLGIHDSSLVSAGSREELTEKVYQESMSSGKEYFAERYIDGREFNISVMGNREEPAILPAAEMMFIGYEERGLPRIVNYTAKWQADSYVYRHSVRSFAVDRDDLALVEAMYDASKKCWRLFGLQGYARIDFRVDGEGRPWIIDVNVNPCISGDSGFIAATEKAGLAYHEVVRTILEEAGISFDI